MIKKYWEWIKSKTIWEHILGILMGFFVMIEITNIYKKIKYLWKRRNE